MIPFLEIWKVNAQPDVATLVSSAKLAELSAIEAQIAEVGEKLQLTRKEWEVERERSDRQFMSLNEIKNDTTMAAASARRDDLDRSARAMQQTIKDLAAQAAALRPASVASVTAALAPMRDQAVAEMKSATAQLYRAIDVYNVITVAIEREGGPRALFIPRLDLLDLFIEKAAQR